VQCDAEVKNDSGAGLVGRRGKVCRHGCIWAASYDHAGLGLRFRTLRSLLGRLREKRRRLALVGPFSAGKTSLLNKLMTEAGLKLPVGLSETTAIPTVVRPSDSVKMFLWNNENLVEADRAVLEEFLRLTRDNVGPILKMYLRTHDEVVLNVPMHRAFRDLEFVDLPGLLGSDRTLEEKAFLHALASDGVVYVVDAQQGITKTDREFIAKIVKEGLRIFLVGTHMDLVKPS